MHAATEMGRGGNAAALWPEQRRPWGYSWVTAFLRFGLLRLFLGKQSFEYPPLGYRKALPQPSQGVLNILGVDEILHGTPSSIKFGA